MDCCKTLQLISPFLDGLLSDDDRTLLLEHVDGCQCCRSELAFQEKISVSLKEIGRNELQAPPELCSLVMGKLKKERGSVYRMIPVAWRRAITAAAAILLIAGSSAGLTTGLKLAGNDNIIGFAPSASNVITDKDADKQSPDSSSGYDKPQQEPLSVQDDTISNKSNPPSSSGVNGSSSSNEDNSTAGIKTNFNPAIVTPETSSTIKSSATALLSSEMKLNSTIIKINVNDLAATWGQVVAIANDAGATLLTFPEQNSGKNVWYVRLTVETSSANDLIMKLAGLGALGELQNESNDITYLYNETLVKYQELQYQASTEGDAATKQQLENQALSCKKKLDNWSSEANKRVVNLWMESN